MSLEKKLAEIETSVAQQTAKKQAVARTFVSLFLLSSLFSLLIVLVAGDL
jgi:hypothetical protein